MRMDWQEFNNTGNIFMHNINVLSYSSNNLLGYSFCSFLMYDRIHNEETLYEKLFFSRCYKRAIYIEVD